MAIFDTFLFNSLDFNGSLTNNPVYSTDRLVFENFSLSDGTVMVMQNLLDSGPSREIVGGPAPRDHGEYVVASYFRERYIEASGIVVKSTAAALDAYLDTIRSNLAKQEGNLDLIDSNGTVKRFVATCDSFDTLYADRRGYNITIAPWKARFVCKTPFGLARAYSSYSLGFSTSPTTQSIVNSGTYTAKPIFTLIFTAANTATVVNVQNVTTGEQIQYSGTIAANDILVFNSEAKSVTKNGVAVDYSGSFVNLNVAGNLITTTIKATSFTTYMTYSHKSVYL